MTSVDILSLLSIQDLAQALSAHILRVESVALCETRWTLSDDDLAAGARWLARLLVTSKSVMRFLTAGLRRVGLAPWTLTRIVYLTKTTGSCYSLFVQIVLPGEGVSWHRWTKRSPMRCITCAHVETHYYATY